MKRLSSYLHVYLVLMLFSAILGSCGGASGYRKNDEISKGRREDMKELNDRAIAYIKKGDTKTLANLLSEEMLNTPSTDAKVQNIGHAMVIDSFTRFDEYDVRNKYINADTIKSGLKTQDAYRIIYAPVKRDMYFSMFLPADKAVPNKQLVTLVYAKYGHSWRICALEMQPYGYNGKTAQQLFETAKTQYNNRQLIDAVNNATLATVCLRPSDGWIYDNEAAIYALLNKAKTDANKVYKYPVYINDVPTRPYIISLSYKLTREGNFPLFTYITKIKTKNTAAIENENMQIRKALVKLMPGIDKNNQYVYYMAYNELPSMENYRDRYDMMDKHW